MTGLAVAILVGATLIPDEGLARGRGGARVGGVGGVRIGGYGGRGRVRSPGPASVTAGTQGGRYGYRGVGWGVGAAAVGAAAADAYHNTNNNDYSNSCYGDSYGQLICPNGYQYGY